MAKEPLTRITEETQLIITTARVDSYKKEAKTPIRNMQRAHCKEIRRAQTAPFSQKDSQQNT